MPKTHPAFIIDRSQRSEQSNHRDDFIACTDREVGFVARAYKLNKTQIEAHNQRVNAMPQEVADCTFTTKNFGDMAVVMEVVHLLYPPLVNRPRIKSLLKKGLKAYLYGEVDRIGYTDVARHIAVIEDVLNLLAPQREALAEINGEAAASAIIQHLSRAGKSLETLKILFNGAAKN